MKSLVMRGQLLVAQAPLTQGVMEQLRVQMFRPDNQLAEEYVLQCKVSSVSPHARFR